MTDNLEHFYWNELLSKLSHEDRNHAVMVLDDIVVVNFDSIYLRECSLRGPDQLLYILHQKGHGRRFLFLSEDGAVLRQCGAIPIIENVINCFNLNKDTYISDPEWFLQLDANQKIMDKFGTELKELAIVNADKVNLIINEWHDVHPPFSGYAVIADTILPYL